MLIIYSIHLYTIFKVFLIVAILRKVTVSIFKVYIFNKVIVVFCPVYFEFRIS